MNNLPSIAIIIPIYNGEKYLSECFDSILNQTYRNFIIYLMNDGSTDSSGDICRLYCDKFKDKIKYFSLPNGGANRARKIALDESDEDLVFFVDQDDYLADKTVLEKASNEFQRSADLEFIIFKYTEYFEKSNIFKERKNFQILKDDAPVSNWLKLFIKRSTIPLSPWDKVFKRSFLIKNDIHLSTEYIASDINWFIDIFNAVKKFKVINDVMYVYRRQVGTSMTTQKFNIKKFIDLLKIIEDEYSKISNVKENLIYSIKSFLAYEYCILIAMTSNLNDEEFNQYYQRISSLESLLKFRENYKVKIAYFFIKILGLRYTSRIMRWYIYKFVNRM